MPRDELREPIFDACAVRDKHYRPGDPTSKRNDPTVKTPGMARFEACVFLEACVEERYYRGEACLVPEAEWAAFEASLRRPLPYTFRVPRKSLEDPSFDRVVAEIRAFGQGTRELRWYGGSVAWRLIARDGAPPEKGSAVHRWLVENGHRGTVVRQEAVSMVPALLLGAIEGDLILDACAAPGNKSAQLLEAVGVSGLLVANDGDRKRAAMLAHQLARLGADRGLRCVVTAHDAAKLPGSLLGPFDRVLCDVPCSGDGTIRKAPREWQQWRCSKALKLHATQLRIARHAATFLKPGGTFVYSTCSLNPIENEAVVAQLLREAPDLDLVDACAALRQRGWTKACRGRRRWRVCVDDETKEGKIVRIPHFDPSDKRLLESMFPPPAEDESSAPPLERTVRILPHDTDTGGFFVAAFVKKKKAAPKNNPPAKAPAATAQAPAPKKQPAPPPPGGGEEEGDERDLADAYRPVAPEMWAPVARFFACPEDPKRLPWTVHVRSDGPHPALWALPRDVAHLVGRLSGRVHVVNAGVKIFLLNGGGTGKSEVPYRIAHSAAALVAKLLSGSPRCIVVDAASAAFLVGSSQRHNIFRFDQLPAAVLRDVEPLSVGSTVAVLAGDPTVALALWRGANSLNVMHPDDDLAVLRDSLPGAPQPFHLHQPDKEKAASGCLLG